MLNEEWISGEWFWGLEYQDMGHSVRAVQSDFTRA